MSIPLPILGAVEGWEEWVAFGALLVGFVASTVGIVNRWVVQPIVKNQKESARAEAEKIAEPIVVRLETVEEKLERVFHETQFNGGHSMRDAVRRIELTLTRMQGRFEQHDWDMHHTTMPDRPQPEET